MAQSSDASQPQSLDHAVWQVLTDAYLQDAWHMARSAGLSPEAATAACEVTVIRLLELLDSPPAWCLDGWSLSGWVVRTLLAEIHRARRVEDWRRGAPPESDLGIHCSSDFRPGLPATAAALEREI